MNSIEPKIAVYSIALNEEKHVRRWYESAREADLVLLADTGSSDKTIPIAKSLGVTTYSIDVNPWRFDVARNASLALIPEDFDICIQLDLDEVLPEAWRGVVTQAWRKGNYWPTYKHVTSRYTDGKARKFQHYFKIHPRNGFFWKYPIHEILVPNDGANFSRELIDLEVDHLKDHSKSRGNYLHLLELAVSEMPNDWRMNHYLCREYMNNRNWLRVLQTAYASLELTSTWDVEAASTCMWAAEAAWNLGMKPLAEEWARRGTDAAPNFYEAWHWRAHIAHLMGDWQECLECASKILMLSRQDHHLVKPDVWEWWGYDLIALASHNLGFSARAIEYGQKALRSKPSDTRLQNNLKVYCGDIPVEESNPNLSATVLWAILAKDAEKTLPLYLESLLSQNYPKNQIGLYIKTNDNRDETEKVLKEFIDEHGHLFLEIHFDHQSVEPDLKKYEQHEWNSQRFQVLGRIRQDSLNYALGHKYDFYFCSDTDIMLLNHVLSDLLSLNLGIVAPMLRTAPSEYPVTEVDNKNYSNFYFADDSLNFKNENKYYELLNRTHPGTYEVPMIHCSYLIRSELFKEIDYLFFEGNWEYKNLIFSLRRTHQPLWLDNRSEHGVITFSNDVGAARLKLKGLQLLNQEKRNEGEIEKVFNNIYAMSEWGYKSGPGSDPEFSQPFTELINGHLENPKVVNILDVGCGDFRLGRCLNLTDKCYTGMDVSSLILEDVAEYSSDNLKFIHADFETWASPIIWDLVIIKDVLQHLPNNKIDNIISKIKQVSRIAIICNDFQNDNVDVAAGGYRKLNLNAPPFNANLVNVLEFAGKQVLEFRME